MSESFQKGTQVSLCQILLTTHTKEDCCTINWFWGSSVTLQLTSQHICLAGARVGHKSLRWQSASPIWSEGYGKSMGRRSAFGSETRYRPSPSPDVTPAMCIPAWLRNLGHLSDSLLPCSTSPGTWTVAGRLSLLFLPDGQRTQPSTGGHTFK